MDRLPTEILQKIFTLLHQQDKMESMIVCQKWAQIIEHSCLFHTLLVNGKNALERITKTLKEKPQKATQVECLLISAHNCNSIDLDNICLLLPHLRFLFINAIITGFSEKRHVPQPWSNHIEHMIILNNRLGVNFLSCGEFSKLTNLTLHGLHITKSNPVINMLSKAPNLTHLKTRDVHISIAGFELLHNNLPSLRSLSLSRSTLESGRLPYEIIPCGLVSEFRVDFVDQDIKKQFMWLEYITTKYPNISTLEVINYNARYNDQEKEYVKMLRLPERQISCFKKLGHHLKTLTLDFHILPQKLFDHMEFTAIQLKHLTLPSSNFFPMIEYMKISRQFNSIETLELGKVFPENLQWLKEMPRLKKFALKMTSVSLLDSILKECPPTLESLELDCDGHYLLYNDSKVLFSIKSLVVKAAYLPEAIENFISEQLPMLTSLSFIDCHFKERIVRIPKHHLLYFRAGAIVLIITPNDKTIYSSRFGTDVLNLARPYQNSHLTSLYPYTEAVIYNTSEHYPHFILVCASVRNVDTL